MDDYKAWLRKQKQSKGSIRCHTYNLKVFQDWYKEQCLSPQMIRQSDILAYLKDCKERGNQNRTLAHKLHSIKKYFDYLNIKPNPTLHLQIKGMGRTLPTGLLNEKQLNQLYENYPQNTPTQQRNKVMLGLLIYQGITSGELLQLQGQDVDLKREQINIPSSRRSAPRLLALQPQQIPLLKTYIHDIRPALLQVNSKTLIVNSGHSHSPDKTKNTFADLIRQLRKRHPGFKNAQQLRASRIVLWLKSHNLRQVQYMAGHRYISATEKYQLQQVEDLQKQLSQYHPLLNKTTN